MKRNLLLVAALTAAMGALVACSGAKSAAGAKSTPYTEVRNYFFNNEQTAPTTAAVTSRADFERLFGAAAFMGKGGEPTQVDFDRQFVIAVVLPETNVDTDIRPVGLTSENGRLTFAYRVVRGQSRSFFIRPLYLIAVDRKYLTADVRGVEQP